MFNKLTIKAKLITLFVFVFFGVLTISCLSMYQSYNDMINFETKKIQSLIQTANSNIQAIYNKHKKEPNTFTLQMAKNEIKNSISSLSYDGNNYFWIHDLDLKMISHPKESLVNTDISQIKDPDGVFLFQEMNKIVKKNKEGEVGYKWASKSGEGISDKMSYVMLFEPLGWVIGTGVYLDEIQESFFNDIINTIIQLLIFLTILPIVLFFIAKSILKPLNETLLAVEDISKGNGDLTKRLEINGNNEISKLREAINFFSSELSDKISIFKPVSEDLKNNADLLNTISKELSDMSDNQNKDVDSTATAMEEMLATTSEITKNTNNTANSVSQVMNELDTLKKEAKNSNNVSNDLDSELVDSMKRAEELVNSTEEVIQVISVINGIAEQTNLLALNAAIEAARAGEQGRGFAVVAEEVRNLSSKTQESVKSIADVINSMKGKVELMSNSVNKTQEFSNTSKKSVEKTLKVINKVTEEISNVNDLCQQIAAATEQQKETTVEINHNISRINDSSKELTEKNHIILGNVNSLNNINNEVTNFINKFKI